MSGRIIENGPAAHLPAAGAWPLPAAQQGLCFKLQWQHVERKQNAAAAHAGTTCLAPS